VGHTKLAAEKYRFVVDRVVAVLKYSGGAQPKLVDTKANNCPVAELGDAALAVDDGLDVAAAASRAQKELSAELAVDDGLVVVAAAASLFIVQISCCCFW